MRIIVFLFFNLFVSVTFCQQDTLNVVIKHRKIGADYILYEQKIGVILDEGLTFNTMRVHNYFIPIIDKAQENKILLRFFDKKGRIFALGLWNESGFHGVVIYYDRKGRIEKTVLFEKEFTYPL